MSATAAPAVRDPGPRDEDEDAGDDGVRAATFQRLHPRAYLARFLAERVRPDGRDAAAHRALSVHLGAISTADGSALVRLGATTVVCGVKAELAPPDLAAPALGFVVPNLDLPALCAPRFRPGPPADDAQVLAARLNAILAASAVVPRAALCVHPRRAVWVLYVDATCINYDGNVLDAALIAMVAALRNTRLPKATYDEDTGRTVCSRTERFPLPIGASPLAVSFGLFDSTHLLADPTAFEEPLLDTTVTVVCDDAGDVLSVTQAGLASEDVLSRCIAAAKARCTSLRKHVYK